MEGGVGDDVGGGGRDGVGGGCIYGERRERDGSIDGRSDTQ